MLRRILGIAAICVLALGAAPTLAQTPPGPAPTPAPAGSLTALIDSGIYAFNGLEIASAKANDAAYAALLADGCGQFTAAANCSGSRVQLFNQLRELEDTADALLGRGETTYSLRLGAQALGFALRWTADDEYAAQGSMTTKFANSQMSALGNRFSALRFATLVRFARRDEDAPDVDEAAPKLSFYGSGTPVGGGAGDATSGFPGSNWSAFANGSYSAGSKAPTTFEDAFNYNDTEYTAGSDLRLNSHVVVGLLAGSTVKNVNFNSSESIVDGGIRGDGYSAIVYTQIEGDAAYVNASLGFQHLNLDTRRAITYPSLNPLIPSVNQTSTSSTSASSWIGAIGTGYTFHWRGFSAEPYLNGQYVNTEIAAFTEHGGGGFDTNVGSQSIPSLTSALGLKFSQAFLPPFGVFVPYVYGEFRHEFMENSYHILSVYAATGQSLSSSADFDLPTDAPPRNYYTAGAGLTIVLKGGLQGFLQFVRVLDFTNYSEYVASGGVRYEF